MADYTPHQRKIIERYYDHRDDIALARLGEIVSELYLTDSDKKTKQLWSRAEKAMNAMKVPGSLIRHIIEQGKPDLLARHLKDWQTPGGRSLRP